MTLVSRGSISSSLLRCWDDMNFFNYKNGQKQYGFRGLQVGTLKEGATVLL